MSASLGAGWALAFMLSLHDVVLASFTTGPGATTLPVYLFSLLPRGFTPEANPLAAVMLAGAALLLLLALGILGLRRGRVETPPSRE